LEGGPEHAFPWTKVTQILKSRMRKGASRGLIVAGSDQGKLPSKRREKEKKDIPEHHGGCKKLYWGTWETGLEAERLRLGKMSSLKVSQSSLNTKGEACREI